MDGQRALLRVHFLFWFRKGWKGKVKLHTACTKASTKALEGKSWQELIGPSHNYRTLFKTADANNISSHSSSQTKSHHDIIFGLFGKQTSEANASEQLG